MAVLRFPNAVSDIPKFLRTYQILYKNLASNNESYLDDMVEVMIQNALASSQGAVGREALRRSTRSDRTRDPLYNQLKMYSELYRMLGWIRPGRGRLIFHFPDFSEYIGNPNNDLDLLVSECILSIVFPNPNVTTRSGNIIRPFPFLLKMMRMLDGIIFRDEIIVSVLSLQNDCEDNALSNEVDKINRIRGNFKELEEELFFVGNGLQINTLRNYTRIPIGFLRDMGWAIPIRSNKIYDKSLVHYMLTDCGYKLLSDIDKRVDIRHDLIAQFDFNTRCYFNLLSYYVMLERSGFDVSPVTHIMEYCYNKSKDITTQLNVSNKSQIFYSPFQQSPDNELEGMLKISEEIE